MSDIKNKLIKIAYENPELRAELLPLIMKVATSPAIKRIQDEYKLSDEELNAALDAVDVWREYDLSNMSVPDRLKDEPFRKYRAKEQIFLDMFGDEHTADTIIDKLLKVLGARKPLPKEDDYW